MRRDYYVINNYGLVTGSVGNTRCLELTYLSVISYALQYHLTLTAGWIVPTNLNRKPETLGRGIEFLKPDPRI